MSSKQQKERRKEANKEGMLEGSHLLLRLLILPLLAFSRVLASQF